MEKSPDAFRTISEVADHLKTPAHVLRFWETRFPQIKPVKRAGGRRSYRPADVALLAGIRRLLHDEGMTIRGVQKILREQGIRHVAGLTGSAPEAETDLAALLPDFEEGRPAMAERPDPAPYQTVAVQTPPAPVPISAPSAQPDLWSQAQADPGMAPDAPGTAEDPVPGDDRPVVAGRMRGQPAALFSHRRPQLRGLYQRLKVLRAHMAQPLSGPAN